MSERGVDPFEAYDRFSLCIKLFKDELSTNLKKNHQIVFEDIILKKISSDTITDLKTRYNAAFSYQNFNENELKDIPYGSDILVMYELFINFHYNFIQTLYFQILGDTLGYNNGKWEFNYDQKNPGYEYTNELLYEYIDLGGIAGIDLTGWLRSDDSIMYQATFEVLLESDADPDIFGERLQKKYIEIMPKMADRHPGNTVMRSLNIQKNIKWDTLPYSSDDIGSGASMRSGCIGLFYSGVSNRRKLIALATECARITHNSAIGILGSIVAALFTAYAIEKKDIYSWPSSFIDLYKSGIIDEYIKESRPHEYEQFARDKILFYGQWEKYVTMRFTGKTPRTDLKILKNPVTRIKYLSENFSKGHTEFPGANSDDSVIIAYDSLISSLDNVEKNIIYSILHIGDSDTIGSISLSWQRAYYNNIPLYQYIDGNIDYLEDIDFVKNMYDSQEIFSLTSNIFILNIYRELFIEKLNNYYKIKYQN